MVSKAYDFYAVTLNFGTLSFFSNLLCPNCTLEALNFVELEDIEFNLNCYGKQFWNNKKMPKANQWISLN